MTSDEEVALWLLDQAHVATVPGTPFGAPGYLRFSYACSEEDIDGGHPGHPRRRSRLSGETAGGPESPPDPASSR